LIVTLLIEALRTIRTYGSSSAAAEHIPTRRQIEGCSNFADGSRAKNRIKDSKCAETAGIFGKKPHNVGVGSVKL
jgi:hypothetical protein